MRISPCGGLSIVYLPPSKVFVMNQSPFWRSSEFTGLTYRAQVEVTDRIAGDPNAAALKNLTQHA